LYIISYDLKKPGRNYRSLFKAIKECGTWWHYLESTWIVSTSMSSKTISEKLRAKIDKNDKLLIIKATKDFDGWLAGKAWTWLRRHQ